MFVEDERHELKREVTRDFAKEIVAFLNTQGGRITVGVNDSGEVVGLDCPDDVQLQVTDIVRDAIEPDASLLVECERVEREGRALVVVRVREGTEKPYYLRGKGLRPEGVYLRRASSSSPATRTAIRRMIMATDTTSFEELPSFASDLTFRHAEELFQKRGLLFGWPQMRTLGFLGADGLFTNLALLLSDQCPHTIKLARLHGTPGDFSFQDRAEFSGSLFKQLEDAYAAIDAQNGVRSTFSGLYRTDSRDYPDEAVRECLINAIVHRDYATSAPLLIKTYDTSMEVINFGGLMPGIELDDILMGVSCPRNPRLAEVFQLLDLIEAYGTGIRKMVDSYANDALSPLFEHSSNAFKATLPNRNADLVSPRAPTTEGRRDSAHLRSRTADGAPSPQNTAQARAATRRATTAQTPVPLPRIEEGTITFDPCDVARTLEFAQSNGTLTRAEVEQLLDVGQTTAGKLLRQLVQTGSLVQEGRGPRTRYRLAG